MYAVFNELCEEVKLSDEVARDSINCFIRFLIKMHKDKIVEGIVAPNDTFGNRGDIEQYSFSSWLNDNLVDKEHKRLFRLYKGKHINYIEDETGIGEFLVNDSGVERIGIGCTVAHETKSILISRATNPMWQHHIVNGTYVNLDDDGKFVSSEENLVNLNESLEYQVIKQITSEVIFANISSGYDLWEQREVLYPNLIFCDSVRAQLYSDPERFHILKIMERLNVLQNYFSQEHDFYEPSHLGLNARTESDSVKKDPELKKYRLFSMPGGKEKYFYDHISFTGKFSGGRIYFYPMISEKRCYIGYIGRHLPTKKY